MVQSHGKLFVKSHSKSHGKYFYFANIEGPQQSFKAYIQEMEDVVQANFS